jgi:hypothetical protein
MHNSLNRRTRKNSRISSKHLRKNARKSIKHLFKGGDDKKELDKLDQQLEVAEKNLIDYRKRDKKSIDNSEEEKLSGIVFRLVKELEENFKSSPQRDALIKHFNRPLWELHIDYRLRSKRSK